MMAAREGHTETVVLLNNSDANVTAKTKNFHTPLMTAAEYGHTETVRALLDSGAEVNARAKESTVDLRKTL